MVIRNQSKRLSSANRARLSVEQLESRLAPAFATFRSGITGVMVQDSGIAAATPSTIDPNSPVLTVAGANSADGTKQALIKFTNLFSVNSQIPANATIKSASLTLWAMGASAPTTNIEFHRILTPWAPLSATWDSFGNGIQANDVEASATATGAGAMTGSGWNPSGRQLVVDVQAWQLGNAPLGWVITTPSSSASWSFASSEDADSTHRPTLTVEYTVSGSSNPSYSQLLGTPPSPLKLAWFDWSDTLLSTRLARVPLYRENTYYFAQNGDDLTGLGTIDQPWKTLAKAQNVLDNTAGNVRLRFRRGDVWRESTAITINNDGVTIDDYGSAALPKPDLSRFQLIANSSWTQVQGNLYKLTAPPNVGWLREAADGFTHIYYRSESSTDVVSRSYSWYYDATGSDPVSGGQPTLYANVGGAMSSLVGGLEYCPGDGLGFATYGDNIRLQNLRLEGQGVIQNGQGYGLNINQTNREEFVGVGLDVFYTGYHAIGQIVHGPGGKGFTTLVNCQAGLCVNRYGNGDSGSGDVTVYVAYGDYGGNEYIQDHCTIAYGALPSADWQAVPGMPHGQGLYTHTGVSGYLDLVIATGTSARPTVNPVILLNHIDAAPQPGAIEQVRAFIVEDQSDNPESFWHSPGVAMINCKFSRTSTPLPFLTSAVFYDYPFQVGSWLINCTVSIDASAVPWYTTLSLIQSGPDSSRYINCHIDIYNANTNLYIRNPNYLPDTAGGVTVTNSIISLDTNMKSGLGLVNDADHLQHNAYYVHNPDPSPMWKFDGDPGAVTLTRRYQTGLRPSPSSPLYNGGLAIGLEYDQNRQIRGSLVGIGPLVGEALPTPTQITYKWGSTIAELQDHSTIWASGVRKIMVTFPIAVDIQLASVVVSNSAGPVAFAGMTYNTTTQMATWTFAAPLAKGRYRMYLDGALIREFNVLPGDLDGDGFVNYSDVIIMRNSFGFPGVIGDLDGNGMVDQYDLIAMKNLFGTFI